MLLLSQDFKEFIQILNQLKVEYLVVGGWAFSYYATPRLTGDIDFFVNSSKENSIRLQQAFSQFGYDSLGLQDDSFCGADRLLQIGVPPNKIDIFTHIPGLSFSDAWDNKVQVMLPGIEVFLVSKSDLIKSKEATQRTKDKADLEELLK